MRFVDFDPCSSPSLLGRFRSGAGGTILSSTNPGASSLSRAVGGDPVLSVRLDQGCSKQDQDSWFRWNLRQESLWFSSLNRCIRL